MPNVYLYHLDSFGLYCFEMWSSLFAWQLEKWRHGEITNQKDNFLFPFWVNDCKGAETHTQAQFLFQSPGSRKLPISCHRHSPGCCLVLALHDCHGAFLIEYAPGHHHGCLPDGEIQSIGCHNSLAADLGHAPTKTSIHAWWTCAVDRCVEHLQVAHGTDGFE